jgi:hypothetical protein
MLPAFPVCELLMAPVLGFWVLLFAEPEFAEPEFAEPEFADSAPEAFAADPASVEPLLLMD